MLLLYIFMCVFFFIVYFLAGATYRSKNPVFQRSWWFESFWESNSSCCFCFLSLHVLSTAPVRGIGTLRQQTTMSRILSGKPSESLRFFITGTDSNQKDTASTRTQKPKTGYSKNLIRTGTLELM
ncbi:hypothetical protein NL108_017205 [Boleophthalmus pectinirostris]|nr:hypothetical protein NL108_017205 [Boleophthalmus pectinirostris]